MNLFGLLEQVKQQQQNRRKKCMLLFESLLIKKSGTKGNDVPILYGGSCKPANAVSLFSQPDIDGGLIGAASLNAQDFIAIANSF